MLENLLTIVAVAGAAGVVTALGSILFSARIRRHGVVGALRSEYSQRSKLINPYRG
jgi:hypothetical protein